MGGILLIELAWAIWSYLNAPIAFLPSYLLGSDILVPIIVLVMVAALKPLNLFLRRRVIEAAKAKRAGLKDLLVIGITGSYGKTSTKEFLYTILKDKFKVVKTPEHVNTEIGIANFILSDLKPEHEIFICEIGAYVKGEVRDICNIVRPKIGIFVGANEQHLSLFGSMENLLKAEGGEELLEALPSQKGQQGLAIFNGNNKYAYELWKKAQVPKKIAYAPTLVNIINPERRDIRAENIEVRPDKIKFHVISTKDSKGADFMVNLLGRHNIENILLAAATAEALGMKLPEIARGAFKIDALKGTMSIKKTNGINVINSTYSSNPTAVEAHLEYLKTWGAKKIVIMPCLIELGSASVRIHEHIGELLGKTVDLAIITTRERFHDIRRGAGKVVGDAGDRIIHLENPSEIMHKIKLVAEKGDVLLLEGRLPYELVKDIENMQE